MLVYATKNSFVILDSTSDEETEIDSEPSMSRAQCPLWRCGAPFRSLHKAFTVAVDTHPELRQSWMPSEYFTQYLSEDAYVNLHESMDASDH